MSLPAKFFASAHRWPDRRVLFDNIDERWVGWRYADLAEAVSKLAGALADLGVQARDRVVICSENRSQWVIADLAVLSLDAIAVPTYSSNTRDDHHYILQHAQAQVALVAGGRIGQCLLEAAAQLSDFKHLIAFDALAASAPDHIAIHQLDQLLDSTPARDLAPIIAKINDEDTCTIIYTSGTSNRPKGVMLSHRALQANVDMARSILRLGKIEQAILLSILPLAHAYEHIAGVHMPLQMGAQVYYCKSADKFAGYLKTVRPTIMTAVPRLYELMYDKIQRETKNASPLAKKLIARALTLGTKTLNGQRLNPICALENALLGLLVRRKIRAIFGGRLAFFISGGAPLNPQIGTFFIGLGIKILQGYGQTEMAPMISANPPGKIKIATVGTALPGVEVKLADDGELLTRGDGLMNGYWCDEHATEQAIVDDWLHTGDLVSIDDEGYLSIIGRKKEMIVNSGGDNIAPGYVEAQLLLAPEIDQVMVSGDKRPWLAAIIVPARSVIDQGDLSAQQAQIQTVIANCNRTLSNVHKIRKFILADEPFSIENHQMTPTLKPKRRIIEALYGERIDNLYNR